MTKDTLKKYEVKLKVEKIYTIHVDAYSAEDAADAAQEDYELGNQDNSLPEETHWIEKVQDS